jgi:SagB-type dehydrogenase family enzyme
VTIKLPQQESESNISLASALRQRETRREYLGTPLSLLNLSSLLFAGQGMRGSGSKLLAPSAQEQYPLSTFVVVNNVSDIAAGLYRYHNSDHSLAEIEKGSFAALLEGAAIGEQVWVGKAAAIIILAGNIQRMNQHFSEQPPVNERGERYVYIEAGAVAQNIQLQGTALNIGMVLVGGFNNETVKSILKLPPELEPTALLCIGNV